MVAEEGRRESELETSSHAPKKPIHLLRITIENHVAARRQGGGESGAMTQIKNTDLFSVWLAVQGRDRKNSRLG